MQNIQNTIKHTDQKYYINCEHVFNMLIQIWHYTKICFSVISFLNVLYVVTSAKEGGYVFHFVGLSALSVCEQYYSKLCG